MKYVEILITNILPSKTSFGQTGSGEQIFIPSAVAAEHDLEVGTFVNAMLVVNTMNPQKTPWLCIKILKDEHIASNKGRDKSALADFIVHELTENGRATPEELAEIAGEPVEVILANLEDLKAAKIIAPAVCWDIVEK
jgi:hypothetical protein